MNWVAGWWLILAGFASGAALGLFFHRAEWLGGYGSFRRRMLRLGHIALCMLGMLNVIAGLSSHSSPLLVAGGAMMPAVCFLTAWKEKCRHLFFLPVLALLTAVVLMLTGRAGWPQPAAFQNETARWASAPYRTTGGTK
jgi:hypothetical protein